jgi:cellulase/cellobiase CelA1
MEGGAADASCPAFAAAGLNYIDGRSTRIPGRCPRSAAAHGARAQELPIRGFFVNDTHFDWTSREVRYGAQVAALTGLHFIVATQDNGQGPMPQEHKVENGNSVLCNPANAGLGPRPTTDTGYSELGADAFEWSGVPGLSGGNGPGCNGVRTPPGNFDLGFALQLAANANERLGPGHSNRPY